MSAAWAKFFLGDRFLELVVIATIFIGILSLFIFLKPFIFPAYGYNHPPLVVCVPMDQNMTQIQYLGGYDAGFVGTFLIETDSYSITLEESPRVGKSVWVTNASSIKVFAEDASTGTFYQIGGI
jgi:hypothetical protein